MKEIKVGQTYKTYGGWEAIVIWVSFFKGIDGLEDINGFYAIHFPRTAAETTPIYHWGDGTAHSAFSVSEPPVSNKHHPADIIFEEAENEKP